MQIVLEKLVNHVVMNTRIVSLHLIAALDVRQLQNLVQHMHKKEIGENEKEKWRKHNNRSK